MLLNSTQNHDTLGKYVSLVGSQNEVDNEDD